MLLEIGARLLLRDADALEHVLLLHLLDHHLLLEHLPQAVERHAFLRERRLELLVGVEVVLLADVLDDAVELIVAHLQPELAPALHHQHLVDGVDDHARRDLAEHRRERLVAAQRIRVEIGPGLPQGGHLQLLEVGHRDDLAVHLDEHLLDDDLRPGGGGAQQRENDGRHETHG